MKYYLFFLFSLFWMTLSAVEKEDSVYLFSYTTRSDYGRAGLKIMYSHDSRQWSLFDYSFVKSDFGPWGEEKKMIYPCLEQMPDGNWRCIWYLDEAYKYAAVCYSPDLRTWGPQKYVRTAELSGKDGAYRGRLVSMMTPDGVLEGMRVKVSRSFFDGLYSFVSEEQKREKENAERLINDGEKFATLSSVSVSMRPQVKKSYPISDHLFGIFFEDINYGADGGLYAELVQNRDFEYSADDCRYTKNQWNALTAWEVEGGSVSIEQESPLSGNNPHYAVIDCWTDVRLSNSGYDGMPIIKGSRYFFSLFARTQNDARDVKVELVSSDGRILASASVDVKSQSWKKSETELVASDGAEDASLVLKFAKGGQYCLDMISLFPEDTYKGHRNGLRKDLAETLEAMHPSFIRFPGGCVAHGDGIDNMYDWKGSVGPLENRKPLRNIWGYHQTRGLGYYEYFQLCEDLGAEPLPVLAAGVPCQNSGSHSHWGEDLLGRKGQQGGIDMKDMDAYVQDILDLIEWARGDESTKWGRVRAQAGHPKPFNLNYIGIGNEDLITPLFEERFKMIFDAVTSRYPDIKVVGTVGPFYKGTDYDEGWRIARELDIPIVDEHYYNTPGWFINNQDFYDSYRRGGTKVYLGEYAAHTDKRTSTVETALCEALYLTSVERNGDVVDMASYAPLLARENYVQWNPDMIYFNNTEIKPTVCYHVQRLFGCNSGDTFIPMDIRIKTDGQEEDVAKRIGISLVKDSKMGKHILKIASLLPVEVSLDVILPGLSSSSKVEKTVISGSLDSTSVTPVVENIKLGKGKGITLKPYSLTIISY